jgi:glycosyltransferase 2 family protein
MPRLADRSGRALLRAAGWLLAVVVVVLVGRELLADLRQLRAQPVSISPTWWLIVLSGALFLSAHAVLVQTWRTVLGSWDATLPFWTAARIWSVSSLGRYLPGKIWQIGAMGAMARDVGVSAVAASGSAILGTLVNLVAGFAVALLAGRTLLDRSSGEAGTRGAMLLVALATAALLLAPVVLPRLTPWLGRRMGRPVDVRLPARAVLSALVGNVIAWLLYGAAFQLFMTGLLGTTAGGYPEYLAAYTISYLVGYLVLFAPAGIGAREGAMVTVLAYAGLATRPEAALVALASRLWLTLLEVVPGFLFWAQAAVRRRPPTTDPSDVPT